MNLSIILTIDDLNNDCINTIKSVLCEKKVNYELLILTAKEDLRVDAFFFYKYKNNLNEKIDADLKYIQNYECPDSQYIINGSCINIFKLEKEKIESFKNRLLDNLNTDYIFFIDQYTIIPKDLIYLLNKRLNEFSYDVVLLDVIEISDNKITLREINEIEEKRKKELLKQQNKEIQKTKGYLEDEQIFNISAFSKPREVLLPNELKENKNIYVNISNINSLQYGEKEYIHTFLINTYLTKYNLILKKEYLDKQNNIQDTDIPVDIKMFFELSNIKSITKLENEFIYHYNIQDKTGKAIQKIDLNKTKHIIQNLHEINLQYITDDNYEIIEYLYITKIYSKIADFLKKYNILKVKTNKEKTNIYGAVSKIYKDKKEQKYYYDEISILSDFLSYEFPKHLNNKFLLKNKEKQKEINNLYEKQRHLQEILNEIEKKEGKHYLKYKKLLEKEENKGKNKKKKKKEEKKDKEKVKKRETHTFVKSFNKIFSNVQIKIKNGMKNFYSKIKHCKVKEIITKFTNSIKQYIMKREKKYLTDGKNKIKEKNKGQKNDN